VNMELEKPEDFEARVADVMKLPLADRKPALEALYSELHAFLESSQTP